MCVNNPNYNLKNQIKHGDHEADSSIPKVILEELHEDEVERWVGASIRHNYRWNDEEDGLGEDHGDEASVVQAKQAHDANIKRFCLRSNHQEGIDEQNRDHDKHDDQDVEDDANDQDGGREESHLLKKLSLGANWVKTHRLHDLIRIVEHALFGI